MTGLSASRADTGICTVAPPGALRDTPSCALAASVNVFIKLGSAAPAAMKMLLMRLSTSLSSSSSGIVPRTLSHWPLTTSKPLPAKGAPFKAVPKP